MLEFLLAIALLGLVLYALIYVGVVVVLVVLAVALLALLFSGIGIALGIALVGVALYITYGIFKKIIANEHANDPHSAMNDE
ncbi:MAG: hypothetical protein F4W90_01735 [Gammaproteobacteria bacterium]|nr:hypothetical protein [Gammaproteobacteria bacterium]